MISSSAGLPWALGDKPLIHWGKPLVPGWSAIIAHQTHERIHGNVAVTVSIHHQVVMDIFRGSGSSFCLVENPWA